jgi:predicted nuclease of predicted toxin-antitoxin system
MAALRFYLDENVPVAIADQLRLRGIDVVTVRDMGLRGVSDAEHLQRATTGGYVLCSFDTDFVVLAKNDVQHTGIIIGQPENHGVGQWVNSLSLYHALLDSEDMHNRLDFL